MIIEIMKQMYLINKIILFIGVFLLSLACGNSRKCTINSCYKHTEHLKKFFLFGSPNKELLGQLSFLEFVILRMTSL